MAVEGLRRPAWAEVSRRALRHNLASVRTVVGPSALCGVVKANGYGHGAVAAATALAEAGADGLAVAIFDEGVELRQSGLTLPILMLAETPFETIEEAFEERLTLTIGSLDGARAAVDVARRLGGRHRVHLKVDTGMHRMGVAPDDVAATLEILSSTPTLVVEGLYTHFASADSDDPADVDYCYEQLARLDDAVEVAARVDCTRPSFTAPTRPAR
jgi:alanine racemase